MNCLKTLNTEISLILILVLLIPIAVPLTSFAYDTGEIVKVMGEGEDQTLVFNVTGSTGSSGIRYRTKGWWINAIVEGKNYPQGGDSVFYGDDQLSGQSGDMVVYLPLYTNGQTDANGYIGVLDKLGLTLEDYHKEGTLYLNAGQTVVINGVEQYTNPSQYSKNHGDILRMVEDSAGVSWSSST